MSAPAGKYARYELERRFLARRLPSEVAADEGWQIVDRYIVGTHLRLRRADSLGSREVIYKLGQKQVVSPPDFATMTMTSIYLSAGEYKLLMALPARELVKRRYALLEDGRTFSVDAFAGSLAGLVLAEVGFATRAEMEPSWPLPAWLAREVSDDVRFTGGALAQLSAEEAQALLSDAARRRQRAAHRVRS